MHLGSLKGCWVKARTRTHADEEDKRHQKCSLLCCRGPEDPKGAWQGRCGPPQLGEPCRLKK